jgi:hypothetical protein
MPSADIRTWLLKMLPNWPTSGKMFAMSGRNAPPLSTKVMHGSRCACAICCARTCFLQVMP